MKLLKYIFHKTRRLVAQYWLLKMHVKQIAITGSQGKTAVSQGLYAMLSTLRPTVVTDVNLDTIYNVPITALNTRPYHHYTIFELGIDKLNEMDFHLQIVKPDIAIITGVSPVHSDEKHMKSFENVKKEKRKLVEALADKGVAILNYSDENVRAMAYHTKAQVIWYGRKEDFDICHPFGKLRVTENQKRQASVITSDVKRSVVDNYNYVAYSNIKVTTEGTEFDLHDYYHSSFLHNTEFDTSKGSFATSGSGQCQNDMAINKLENNCHSGKRSEHLETDKLIKTLKTIRIKTKLIGTFHAANITAIYCILKTLNPYFVENFEQGVWESLLPLTGRMNIQNGPNNTKILNDSLRANPTSTAAGLETFRKIEHKSGRKIAILADMGELERPEEEHKKIGKLIAKLPIDIVVCAGKMQKFVAIEAAKNNKIEVHYFDTVDDAKKEIMQIIKPHDFIYLKGSLYSHVGKIFGS